MNPLLAVFDRALGGTAPRAPEPPAPWLVWLVVCLCRQRVRQTWLAEIATRLDGDGSGDVPDLPGWTYYFHGSGLCLSGPGNENLDVDFHADDETAATIDPYFFAHRVDALEPKAPPEAQLYRWLSAPSLVIAGLDALRACGVIEHPQSDHVFRLCPWLEQRAGAIAADDFELEAGDERDGPEDRFFDWLAALVTRRDRSGVRMRDVAERVGARALPWCAAILEGPIDGSTGGAVDALGVVPGDHSVLVAPLLDRLDPQTHHPFIAHAITSYLLAHGRERERALDVALAFAAIEKVTGYNGNPYLDHLAMLVLQHDPPRGLPLVRHALRSSTPGVVGRMASLLAALDLPWTRRELVAALGEDGQTDVSNRRPLAAALARSRDHDTRRIAQQLTPGPPQRDPDDVGYRFDEVVAEMLEHDMYADEVAPIAARLRAVLPDVF